MRLILYLILNYIPIYAFIANSVSLPLTQPTNYLFSLNAVFKTRSGKKPFSNSLINQEGASHITELINERIRISKPGPNRRIIDPKLLYISNVDIEITNGALENFFHHIFGPITVTSHLEKCSFTNRHKGYGKLCFKTAEMATIAMLEYNGVILGRKAIILSEFLYSSKKHDIQDSKIKNSIIITKQAIENAAPKPTEETLQQ